MSKPKQAESPSTDSEPKANATKPQTESSKERSSTIATLDKEGIEKF